MTEEESIDSFDGFGFSEEIMQGIREAGFQAPTPIQQKSIPVILSGRDLMGQALTGTGKTAAFGLPGMERIRGKEGLQMLVLVPTRELAAQVSSELYKLGHAAGIKTGAFTGGQAYYRQEKMLKEGMNLLVATPGRLIDLMESGHFKGIDPAVIVVDEADEMLDMGFIDDVRRIFEEFPGEHQTMLFSATLPKQVVALAKTILKDPIDITTALAEATNNANINQTFFVIEEHERSNAIIRLMDSEDVTKCIIFCRTREEADGLNILLGGRGYTVNCLHGDMEQAQRTRVMAAFRRGEIDILVATDVAARGLDVDDVSHVFNYHLPFDSRSYVHRIGRTGRAGKTGKAITLITPREMRQLEAIRRTVGADIQMGMIPTKEEVNGQRIQKIFAELFAADLDTALYNKIVKQTLQSDQDPTILLTKMLTRELSGGADQGPEHIGVSAERLEAYMAREREERRARFSRGRGGRGGHRGGDRERRFEERGSFRRDDFDNFKSEGRDHEERSEKRQFKVEHKFGEKKAAAQVSRYGEPVDAALARDVQRKFAEATADIQSVRNEEHRHFDEERGAERKERREKSYFEERDEKRGFDFHREEHGENFREERGGSRRDRDFGEKKGDFRKDRKDRFSGERIFDDEKSSRHGKHEERAERGGERSHGGKKSAMDDFSHKAGRRPGKPFADQVKKGPNRKERRAAMFSGRPGYTPPSK